MTLPTMYEIKKFVAKTLEGASRYELDVDTAFYGKPEDKDGEVVFFGETDDGVEFEVTLTIQDINEVMPS